MQPNPWFFAPVWILIPIVAIVCGVVSTWIRAKYGYPIHTPRRGRRRAAEYEEEIEHLTATVEAQKAAIEKLEDRVRVLERIATDPSARLRQEIDRLSA